MARSRSPRLRHRKNKYRKRRGDCQGRCLLGESFINNFLLTGRVPPIIQTIATDDRFPRDRTGLVLVPF